MIASPPLSGVIGRIARLPDTKFEDIKALWKQLFDVPMPTHNHQYLEKRIAYRIQEIDLAKREPGAVERHRARMNALLDAIKREPRLDAAKSSNWYLARCSRANSTTRHTGSSLCPTGSSSTPANPTTASPPSPMRFLARAGPAQPSLASRPPNQGRAQNERR